MGSRGLPGKVLRHFRTGQTLLGRCIARLRALLPGPDDVVVATSAAAGDDLVAAFCDEVELPVIRGPVDSALARFRHAIQCFPSDVILRVRGDTPFVDLDLLARQLDRFDPRRDDYAAYVCHDGRCAASTPAGLTAECLSVEALEQLYACDPPPAVARHVTLGLFLHDAGAICQLGTDPASILRTLPRFRCRWAKLPAYYQAPWLRLICTSADDFRRIDALAWRFGPSVKTHELVAWLARQPRLMAEMAAANARNSSSDIRLAPAPSLNSRRAA